MIQWSLEGKKGIAIVDVAIARSTRAWAKVLGLNPRDGITQSQQHATQWRLSQVRGTSWRDVQQSREEGDTAPWA